MVDVVTPGNLSPVQFSVGGEVANQITVRQDFIAPSGNGAPTAAPAPDVSPFFIDSSTTPQSLYYWDGTTWNLLGDGTGGGGGGTTVAVTAPITNAGTPAAPNVGLDLAALVAALCANGAFQDCIRQAAVGLIRDDGDGTFTAAHDTDGAGNYVYNDC